MSNKDNKEYLLEIRKHYFSASKAEKSAILQFSDFLKIFGLPLILHALFALRQLFQSGFFSMLFIQIILCRKNRTTYF